MHDAAYRFVASNAGLVWPGMRILEIGSYDVNGSVRPIFAGAAYHGIDLRPGPGVDEVADGATYDGGEAYDLVVTTEALEHAALPRALIDTAWRALRPGGRLILTAAGTGRDPHGCDGGWLPPTESYTNIDPADLQSWLADWIGVQVVYNAIDRDVYAVATRPA